MFFREVELQNFRNYHDQKLSFHEKLNLFLGQNAQGKTNLLESLFIMGMGRSFRTNNDREMIAFGAEFAKARAVVCDETLGRDTTVEICYQPEGKIIKVDGIKLDRTVDLLETVYIVVFSPEDLKIIKEGPDNRRRFLDRELCQLKPVYYSDLGNYKKILRQRNALLRQQNRDMVLYDVFNEALADYGTRIIEERQRFVERLQQTCAAIHREISGGKEEIEISYETRPADRDDYKAILEKNFEHDLFRGHTGFGPHKDDLCIRVNGTDIRIFGSQGQQRTAALSMKLAEIALIREETGKNAVLLLDDVMSELDQSRQRYLVEAMKDVQVFITTTEMDERLLSLLPAGYRFEVAGGSAKLLTE